MTPGSEYPIGTRVSMEELLTSNEVANASSSQLWYRRALAMWRL